MNTHRIEAGDLVHVSVPHAHRGHRPNVKARLLGYGEYTGANGWTQYLGAIVTYTSDSGQPHARDRRERGETETIPFGNVTPRNLTTDDKRDGYRVEFGYDRTIPGYANTGVVATHTHGHPNA